MDTDVFLNNKKLNKKSLKKKMGAYFRRQGGKAFCSVTWQTNLCVQRPSSGK